MPKPERLMTLLLYVLMFSSIVKAQDSSGIWFEKIKEVSSIDEMMSSKSLFTKEELLNFQIDSLASKKIYQSFKSLNEDSLVKNFKSQFNHSGVTQKQFIRFQNGYINYNWSFRSNIDTPFLENNISQHFTSSSLNFIVAQSIPIRVSYFGRASNSEMFRDFHDFRIEFNAPEYQKIRKTKFISQFNSKVAALKNPLIKPAINLANQRIISLDEWLKSTSVIDKLIRSKKGLKDSLLIDSSQVDSLQSNRDFVAFYGKVKLQKENFIKHRDSLLNLYMAIERKIQRFQKIADGNTSVISKEETAALLKDSVLSRKELRNMLNGFYSIKSLAIGKSIPNFSDLTVKNISVKGINLEYNHNKLYYAFVAGTIDYRVRDFLYSKQKQLPQYLYCVRLGYGTKEKSHFIVSYYRGKKQLFQPSTLNTVTEIHGVSLASQIVIGKHTKVNAEVAQSAVPDFVSGIGSSEKVMLNFHDRKSGAWHLQVRSSIPQTKTRIEGYYQNAGAAFQNFTSYKVNASVNKWYIKAEQFLWSKQIYLVGNVQKNAFDNPFIEQRYSSNTIFKSLSATFRRRNWPSATIAYLPSSQYTVLDSQIYETHYHLFNTILQHQYRIGEASAVSSLVYSKFFNERSDTGFIFYNSHNYHFNQLINFSRFSTNVAIAHAFNNEYSLNVFDVAVNATIFKKEQLGIGVKVSHLDTYDTKVGFYGTINYTIKKLGAISIRLEKSYLPGITQKLVKSDFYTVGFSRFIF